MRLSTGIERAALSVVLGLGIIGTPAVVLANEDDETPNNAGGGVV